MASFFSGLKSQAISMLPTLIEQAGPQIEGAVKQAMAKMSPQQKAIFSSNLNRINGVVQQEMRKPSPPAARVAGNRKRTLKLKKRKTH